MEVEYHEEYIRNSRGNQLFTCRWLPFSSPKALVFLCHGYGMECSGFMKALQVATFMSSTCLSDKKKRIINSLGGNHVIHFQIGNAELASYGYAVVGIDYEGHGRSMGARCYIKKFDNIVDDCINFFKSICGQEEYRDKKKFLYGESMGGAVALLIHKRDPSFWDGAVLVAPMCKISEKVKPHPLVISMLTRVEDIIPKWKIVPTKDVIDSTFKDPVKREEIRGNRLIYQDKPRLKTALEMLRTSMNLEDSLSQVTLPFFVLHGEADTVTDPEVSRALYERASSSEKTMKLYPGMWHGLTSGEPDSNIDAVFTDIIAWLDKRSDDDSSTITAEALQKYRSDIEKMKTITSSTNISEEKQEKKKSHGKYVCGWKGSRLHHRSAM